jgi:hypothetical protein
MALPGQVIVEAVEIIVAHDLGLFAMMGLASESSPAKLVLALAMFALGSVFADIADAFALPSGNIDVDARLARFGLPG